MKKVLQYIAFLLIGFLIGRYWWSLKLNEESEKITIEAEEETIYTCSMHPQIRQNEPGTCPLCAMELVPLEAGNNESEDLFTFSMKPSAVAMANIQTAIFGRNNDTEQSKREIYLSGKVEIDENRMSVISTNYPGRLDVFSIAYEGQMIQKGTVIASLYAPDLVVAQQELQTALKLKEVDPTIYKAARNKLKRWQLSDAQIDLLEKSSEGVNQIEIIADKTGVVAKRWVQLGDFVSKGQTLVSLINLEKVWVVLQAYEKDLSLIKKGQWVRFTTLALPGQTIKGQVDFIDPLIQSSTRTATVRLSVDNREGNLKPGMLVDAIVTAPEQTIDNNIIPQSAILWTGKRSVVYIQKGSPDFPQFEMREIVLGTPVEKGYKVESGLKPGENYVSNGVFVVDAAAQLNGGYSMINRPENPIIEISKEFRTALNDLLNVYFNLKNNLVESDLENSKNSVLVLEKTLKKLQIPYESKEDWAPFEQTLTNQITTMREVIDLEQLRNEFSIFSDQMTTLVSTFTLGEHAVYIDFCPMAMNDEGAYWLSEFENIRNPYFGSAMMTCGVVKRTFSGTVR